jgi:hypothetical protein
MARFPYAGAAAHIAVDWQPHSERLVKNWLLESERRRAPAIRGLTVAASTLGRTRA